MSDTRNEFMLSIIINIIDTEIDVMDPIQTFRIRSVKHNNNNSFVPGPVIVVYPHISPITTPQSSIIIHGHQHKHHRSGA